MFSGWQSLQQTQLTANPKKVSSIRPVPISKTQCFGISRGTVLRRNLSKLAQRCLPKRSPQQARNGGSIPGLRTWRFAGKGFFWGGEEEKNHLKPNKHVQCKDCCLCIFFIFFLSCCCLEITTVMRPWWVFLWFGRGCLW